MKSFSQRDSQWSNQSLGSNLFTLGRFGCTTTCIADLSTYFGDNLNPLQVSQKIQYINGLVLWGSAKFNNFEFESRQQGRNDVDIKNALQDPNRAAILQVSNGSHWVVATGYTFFGKLKIADPWFGDFTTIDRYQNNITGTAYFKKISPQNLVVNIARIGLNLPPGDAFKASVALYSSNKISCNLVDYSYSFVGKLTQDQAYQIVDQVNPKEKYVMLFFQGAVDSVFYTTYGYPKRNCTITTCPATDPRLLTFELSHQLITWYNSNRGTNPYIEDVDSNFPSDELISTKLSSIAPYYNILK